MGVNFRRVLFAATLVIVALFDVPRVQGASIYLQVPGITGEQSTPGYPGAMLLQSLDISPHQFVATRNADSASPQIIQAVTNGTPFSSAFALLYNSVPAGPPDSVLSFQNVIASGYQLQGGGPTEQDTFVATNPSSIFFELPGIPGESSTPGHPNVMQIDLFSLSSNQFSIVKPVDSASPLIAAAVTHGTLFSMANALFYNAVNPVGLPDGVFAFENIVATQQQVLGGGEIPEERDTFQFVTVIPEPGTIALIIYGISLCVIAGRRSRQANLPKSLEQSVVS